MIHQVRTIHVCAILTTLLLTSLAWAGPLKQVTVFQQGQNGYNTFRIPTIVQANDGTLLAFAEGRVNSASDNGNIDLVLKRSFDGGATWGPLQVIYNNGSTEAGNPAPIVDRNTGNIIIPFLLDRGDAAVYRVSSDSGATWSTAVNFTSQAILPTWNATIFGPVHGIQLERGPHAGRLIIPSYHTLAGQNLNPAGREGHFTYSDDGGVTWHVGGSLINTSGDINPGEATAVELVNGAIYMNHRNQSGLEKRRLKGYSIDGGESFLGIAQVESQLVDPVVQASLVRYQATDQGDAINRILFSNPATETSRVRMTIKSSFDETITWNNGKLVYRGPSGYSDLVKTTTGGGLLYENGTSAYYNRISFARFDTEWLDDPSLVQIDFRDYTAKDQRGNGLDGTFDSNQSYVAGDPRFTSHIALRFDGQDDIVRIDDTSYHALDFDATDSFTLETVFRTSSHTTGSATGSGPLIAKDVGANTPSYWLRVENGKLRFLADDGTESSGVTSSQSVSDGKWHHAAVVFDRATSQIRMYIDYQLDNTGIIDLTGGFSNSNDVLLGAFNASSPGVKRFVGDMDLARISMGALDLRDFVQPTGIPGDANADGVVNLADLQILGDHWGTGDAYWLVGDFTGDGVVNLADLQVLGDHWGYNVSLDMTFDEALAAVGLVIPEPTTMIVLSGIGCLLLPRRSEQTTR